MCLFEIVIQESNVVNDTKSIGKNSKLICIAEWPLIYFCFASGKEVFCEEMKL